MDSSGVETDFRVRHHSVGDTPRHSNEESSYCWQEVLIGFLLRLGTSKSTAIKVGGGGWKNKCGRLASASSLMDGAE